MGSAVLKPFEHVYNKDRPIFEAIRKNRFPLAKKLILSGTDVDCINDIGATPLIETCRAQDISKNRIKRQEFAKFLIENGCNIQKYDIYGWKAVLYAEENGHSSIAKMLNRRESKTSCYKKRDDISFVLTPVMEELEINKADFELRTNNNSQDLFGS